MSRRLLYAELAFQALCLTAAITAWLADCQVTALSDAVAGGYLLLCFSYWMAVGWGLSGDDPMFRRRALMRVPRPEGYVRPKRTGARTVAAIWLGWTGVELAFYAAGWYRWYGAIMAQSVLYMLNSLFLRRRCPLSAGILKNKNGCCKGCSIAAWDAAFFATPLLFLPPAGPVFTAARAIILTLGFSQFVLWEVLYWSHPWRFYPETNPTLTCARCTSRCGAALTRA